MTPVEEAVLELVQTVLANSACIKGDVTVAPGLPYAHYDKGLGCPVIVAGRGDLVSQSFIADAPDGQKHAGIIISYSPIKHEIGVVEGGYPGEIPPPFLAFASPNAASLRVWSEAFRKAAENLEGTRDE